MSGVRLNCGFLSSTPVQQTLLVFVANLGYDFASLAYLFDVLAAGEHATAVSDCSRLNPAPGVLFTVASAAFVLGLVLDVRAANEALQDADLESAKLMSSRRVGTACPLTVGTLAASHLHRRHPGCGDAG